MWRGTYVDQDGNVESKPIKVTAEFIRFLVKQRRERMHGQGFPLTIKLLMRDARENNTGEYQKWYNNQMAVKRLMASFYGIVAFQGFGWADVDLAASITASAREAIRLAAFKAKEMGI